LRGCQAGACSISLSINLRTSPPSRACATNRSGFSGSRKKAWSRSSRLARIRSVLSRAPSSPVGHCHKCGPRTGGKNWIELSVRGAPFAARQLLHQPAQGHTGLAQCVEVDPPRVRREQRPRARARWALSDGHHGQLRTLRSALEVVGLDRLVPAGRKRPAAVRGADSRSRWAGPLPGDQ
jgi:hypothetical protein